MSARVYITDKKFRRAPASAYRRARSFQPGDRVEFWSSEERWKPAVIEPWESQDWYAKSTQAATSYLRLRVGPAVCIIRSAKLVRMASP